VYHFWLPILMVESTTSVNISRGTGYFLLLWRSPGRARPAIIAQASESLMRTLDTGRGKTLREKRPRIVSCPWGQSTVKKGRKCGPSLRFSFLCRPMPRCGRYRPEPMRMP
jgi:hypothetical protein